MPRRLDRRTFITSAATAGVGLGLTRTPAFGQRAPSDTMRVGVMGVNGRGAALARGFALARGADVAYICDVDSRAMEKVIADLTRADGVAAKQSIQPVGEGDVRRILDDQEVDALVIAAPDHWHAPATIMALEAGKHVYVEKPCGHNAQEGEWLVAAQRKYGQVVQMGNQQRSAPESIRIIEEIRDGLIGRPYYARAWYANTRGTIGRGKVAPSPAWLDYELWQGPAPRTAYRDNVIHYNWHWFWRWGTAEINNNGAHEIDMARWALGVDYPTRVTSAGGRYHFTGDDWEMVDTQVASFDFAENKTISWEGRSCNGRPIEGRGRGTSIHGERGTVVLDRNGYVVYDNDNQEIKRDLDEGGGSGLSVLGAGPMTDTHIQNFVDAVHGNASPNAPIDEGHKSVLLCHLGNIAQRTGRALTCDPSNGHIVGDAEAAALWGREYAPGWEPRV
ncbi:MAG: Gfo/Idh/MocA family oxidoreductase [Vicinamibacterales bacterium]|jgi:predicted dehydrogenase|nr:dehydrogenase [Acidobacteriota bacterium]MDP7470858.1 Gfo/Idh/MocA family oxidoreductase [Vicinamibacterales bacterium]MDP7672399.1 Gfo/Idh/MocA family oxidoreductase [Vicinamibacterales bacterium]HJO37501.1 Gfo/Idh/MocA family oxidoreductase [Vicinamibacterales bacterium]